jgi:hypothetical protein
MKRDPIANVNVVQPYEGQFSPPLEPKPGAQDTFILQGVYAIKLHERHELRQ